MTLDERFVAAHSSRETPAGRLAQKTKLLRPSNISPEGKLEQVWRIVVDQALAGGVPSQRMFLERVYPPPKARPISEPIPPIKGPQEALSAIAAIFSALRQGQLIPDETTALLWSLAASFRLLSCKTMKGAPPGRAELVTRMPAIARIKLGNG